MVTEKIYTGGILVDGKLDGRGPGGIGDVTSGMADPRPSLAALAQKSTCGGTTARAALVNSTTRPSLKKLFRRLPKIRSKP